MDVNFSGTTFTAELLSQLLDSVRDPETGRAGFGSAKFTGAVFSEAANFSSVHFLGEATFHRTRFLEDAQFGGAKFQSKIEFVDSEFKKECRFEGARFHGVAIFNNTTIEGAASFTNCTFSSMAEFRALQFSRASFVQAIFGDRCAFTQSTFNKRTKFTNAQFARTADFSSSSFHSLAQFVSAKFHSVVTFSEASISEAFFSSATFDREADFHNTVFGRAVFSEALFSASANFDNTRFTRKSYFTDSVFSKAALFRGAKFHQDVHFVRAAFERAKRMGPIISHGCIVFSGATFERPIILELSAVDLSFQQAEWSSTGVLRVRHAKVDLSGAYFSSNMVVATMPNPFRNAEGSALDDSPISESLPAKITSLQGTDVAKLLLVDADLRECQSPGAMHLDQIRLEGECQFSNSPRGIQVNGWRITRWPPRRVLAEEVEWRSTSQSPRGWSINTSATSTTPAALSANYRHLRKSFEDSKNEPDAADFYYGEMEMRRNDRTRPRSERYLLAIYCLVSGYGLRAGRALVWLAFTIVATLTGLVFWGLPSQAPMTVSNGVIHGRTFEEVTKTPKPVNPSGPIHDRATLQRFEKGFRVVVNSVAFRSSGQVLTTSGTYIEMSSRIIEPVFLGLAVLAIRSRIKR
ncbi:pentapeptide repeat-containing protein [Streptomyces doebereineriae]|nr:pentapeptide repeat-containing protein [Streptomyces sp. DSM 41640]